MRKGRADASCLSVCNERNDNHRRLLRTVRRLCAAQQSLGWEVAARHQGAPLLASCPPAAGSQSVMCLLCELGALSPISVQVQSMDYSTIVFDTAPTGHTLRLLNFPTLLEKGLNKLMTLKGTVGNMMGQVGGLASLWLERSLPDKT